MVGEAAAFGYAVEHAAGKDQGALGALPVGDPGKAAKDSIIRAVGPDCVESPFAGGAAVHGRAVEHAAIEDWREARAYSVRGGAE